MPHTSCPVFQGVVAACSAAPVALVLLIVHCIAVSACLSFWAFAASFVQVTFVQCMLGKCACTVHGGVACLAFLCYVWLPLHAGIACLCYCMLG